METGLTWMDRLAKRLKEARLRAGLSQTELAERIGVSRGAVGQWETGDSNPSNANMRSAADVLGVNVDWLASQRGPMEASPLTRSTGADGERVDISKLPSDQAKVIAAAIADRKAELWRITSDAMVGAGYMPGDLVVVDLEQQPRPQNYVLAESARVPIFRQLIHPYLFCLSISAPSSPLMVDGNHTKVRGVVTSRFSL